jgi:menaquinone-dependent protoporphyrinogen IX oxidase
VKVLVAYESRSGRTQRAASAVADACRADGQEVTVLPLAEVGQDEVEQCDVAAIGSWVEGFVLFAVKPARAATRWLDQAPSLAGKPVGVFVTYAVNPRASLGLLRRGVEARGGKVVAEHSSRRQDPEAGAADFAHRLLAAAG